MEKLFEYGKQIIVPDRIGLERYLRSIWQDHRELWHEYSSVTDITSDYQPFLTFDGNLARANNYIGFIHYNSLAIEIYPKIFHRANSLNKEIMHRHLFYWFSYCKRIKFPFNQSFLDKFDIEQLPEIILYLITRQIHEVINSQPFSAYEEVQEALSTPRSRINFSRYTTRLSYGSYNLIDCDYEPFIFDNTLNRVIKYCARLMLAQTKVADTQRRLNEIIFLLDGVEDQVCTSQQINKIKLPSLFEAYVDVLQSCKMIIENQLYSHAEYEMKNWSLLFPMEYIFEDFVTGFINRHFSHIFFIEAQKSELYLHQDPQTFNIQHDILLTDRKTKEKIIIDTKYKPRWDLSLSDNKRGVSQADIYQMLSYAYKRGTDKVLMIYPNTSDKLADDYIFKVQKSDGSEEIKIKVIDIPFWSEKGHLEIEEKLKQKLQNIFTNEF